MGMPELLVIIVIVTMVFIPWFMISRLKKNKTTLPSRCCLACGFTGPMKTWLANYGLPQFIALVLLFFYVIPGLIFIAWGWGKYKCPKCGALGKNVLLETNPNLSPIVMQNSSDMKKCPFCAESIKVDAIKCRYCSSSLSTA